MKIWLLAGAAACRGGAGVESQEADLPDTAQGRRARCDMSQGKKIGG